MIYKELTDNAEFKQARMLLDSTSTYYPKPTELGLNNYYFDSTESLSKVFGVFENNILISAIFVKFSDYEKSWIAEYVISTKGLPVLGKLFDFVLEYAESCGYYNWYFSCFENSKHYEKALAKYSHKFRYYQGFTETVLMPGKRSSYDRYWVDFQKRIIYKKPMIIKLYALSEQFRKF